MNRRFVFIARNTRFFGLKLMKVLMTGTRANYINQWITSTTHLHFLPGSISCCFWCNNNDAGKIKGENISFLVE